MKSEVDAPLCDSGRLSAIFENHHMGQGDPNRRIRIGTGFRLQCEGHLWEHGLTTWLKDEKTKLMKKINQERRKEGQRPLSQTDAELDKLVLPDQIEQKLRMGLGLLMALAEALHVQVLKINPEPGCQHTAGWLPNDSSLLISSPCKLEPYPGFDSRGLGKDTVRFPPELQRKVPPKDAAPAAGAHPDLAPPPGTGRPLAPCLL